MVDKSDWKSSCIWLDSIGLGVKKKKKNLARLRYIMLIRDKIYIYTGYIKFAKRWVDIEKKQLFNNTTLLAEHE